MSAPAIDRLRPDIEVPPACMRHLPVVRGFPVPWFVGWVGGEPEFRCMDPDKFARALRDKLCWVCGNSLGGFRRGQEHPVYHFVIGPMCGVNRTTAEPPCHLECARYSVKNCPFLSKPQMVRRDNDMPAGSGDCSGHMIRRNPGVILLWAARSYRVFDDGRGGRLLKIGEPLRLEWWSRGRPALRAEVVESVEGGLPALMEMARRGGAADVAELLARKAWLEGRYPA